MSKRQYDRERERDLIRRVKAGDRKAERALLEEHGGLMAKWARHYSRVPGYEFEDAMQQARLGCIDAAMRFELERDIKFSTFAVWRIRFHVERDMQNTVGDVRTPVYQRAKKGQPPVRALRFDAVLKYRQGEDSNGTIADMLRADLVPQDEQIDANRRATAAKAMVPRLIRGLSEREMVIVREHLCRDKADQVSLAEIGRRLGVSRERVRQVRAELVEKLRREAELLGGRELLAA